MRGSDNLISVAFRDAAPIVGDDEHNAFIGIVHSFPYMRKCNKKDRLNATTRKVGRQDRQIPARHPHP